jgi:hypothetical protein
VRGKIATAEAEITLSSDPAYVERQRRDLSHLFVGGCYNQQLSQVDSDSTRDLGSRNLVKGGAVI